MSKHHVSVMPPIGLAYSGNDLRAYETQRNAARQQLLSQQFSASLASQQNAINLGALAGLGMSPSVYAQYNALANSGPRRPDIEMPPFCKSREAFDRGCDMAWMRDEFTAGPEIGNSDANDMRAGYVRMRDALDNPGT